MQGWIYPSRVSEFAPVNQRYLHNFLYIKYNKLQSDLAPSPAGEGWGEEIKINYLPFPSSQPSPSGEGATTLV